MSLPSPSISLWVKAEPFSYGALPIAPHPRLSLHNIKKIITYAKTKGDAGFPHMSYSVWRHIACNKLHISEDMAWMFFSMCNLLAENMSPAERIHWDDRFAACTDQTHKDELKRQVSVSTFQFVLYLYIQQLQKVSLKASLVAGDEWPTRPYSPDLEGRSTPRGGKALDEHSHLVFLQTNIHDILDLLVEPESFSISSDPSITVNAADALGFLLEGSIDKLKTVQSLKDIAMIPTLQPKCGYSKLTKMFNVKVLQGWIKNCLLQNPFGISACIATGRRLSWPLAGEEQAPKGDSKRGKIATNAHIIPRDHVRGNKIVIMSQVNNQTISRCSGTLENSSVKIHRCHHSYLYLLSPLRSVTIEKCRSSTIVLGPVEQSVHVSHCEQLTLIAMCQMILVSGSTLCTLHLLTAHRPILLGGNDTILLAPYHTHYPRLEEHMAAAGICANKNLWDQPLCLGPDHREDMPEWELLPLPEFYMFNIPFEMEGPTRAIPGGLPPKYQRSQVQRKQQSAGWQRMVKEANLSRDQKKELQSMIETHFHVWLSETGHKRELDGLVASISVKGQPAK